MSGGAKERFNLAEYLLDRNVAAGRGGKVALRAGDDSFTYSDLLSLSNRTAGALRELGAEIEDRVLLILPDGPEFVASWLGTLKLGAVFAMANIVHPPEDYLYYLNYTRAPVAVVHESVLGRIETVQPEARHLKALLVVGGDETRSKHPSYETGRPKAAVHTHGDFVYNIERYALHVARYRESDVTVSVPKLFFGYATGTNLMFPFAAGGTTALFPERSTPEKVFEVIEKYRPTVLTSVPTTINAMLSMEEASEKDLSCLRVCLSAGEALPPELYRKWKDRFGVEILDGIGSAEMFHIYISNRFGDVKPGSLGRLVPGYEAKIVGPDGRELAAGEEGTLHIRGGSTALCYWGDRGTSRATFRGDWCVTGDQFRVDPEGYFYYAGRTDDMLKVSGIFVSPLEIEDCLLSHPAVQDVCIVGFEDEGGLTKPKAFVVVREGRSPDDALGRALQDHVKERLSPYKYPRRIQFLTALPRTDRGKVDRRKLREGRC
jgi:benzoate-CoA ligase